MYSEGDGTCTVRGGAKVRVVRGRGTCTMRGGANVHAYTRCRLYHTTPYTHM